MNRPTHHHTLGYLEAIIKYVEADIVVAKKGLEERDVGSPEWSCMSERLFGYESSLRYLVGAKEMCELEQRWNERERIDKE